MLCPPSSHLRSTHLPLASLVGTLRTTPNSFARCNSRRRAALTLVVGLLVALACLSVGRDVKINTDLRGLLPESAPSVRALDELSARKGSTEMFIVAVELEDATARQRLVDSLATSIADAKPAIS